MASPVSIFPESSDEKKWWLAIREKAEGPFSAAYIITALKTGLIKPMTLACLGGTQQWRPVADCPEFAEIAAAVPPPLPTSLPGPAGLAHQRLVTNPRLPTMANWICVYCIAVSPVLWAFNNLSGMTYFDFGVFGPLVSTGITAVLVVGGLRLRDLRHSGSRIIKTVFCIDMGIFVMTVLLMFLSASVEGEAGDTPVQPQNANPVAIPFAVLARLIGLCAYSFELIALIWLHRHGRSLKEEAQSFAVGDPPQAVETGQDRLVNWTSESWRKKYPLSGTSAIQPTTEISHATDPPKAGNASKISAAPDPEMETVKPLENTGGRKEASTVSSIVGVVLLFLWLSGLLNQATKRAHDWLDAHNELKKMLRHVNVEQKSSQKASHNEK